MPDAGPSFPRPRIGGAMTASRRAVLAGLAAVPGLGAPVRAGDALGEMPTLLVAGPAGGQLDYWAGLLVAALQPLLPAGAKLQPKLVGGADGVTGANQFAARVAPDGDTLLLAPGDAVMAWLSGDPRARFDPARWVAVAAGVAPATVVGRGMPEAGRRLRVGMGGTVGHGLAAMLGLELAGFAPTPVFGVLGRSAASQALAAGTVDAVLLRGRDASSGLEALAPFGAAPWFGLETAETNDLDPAAPALPGLVEFTRRLRGAPPAGPLYEAWRGVAAAAQAEFALVLPQLTPAGLVALWRRAAGEAVALPELRQAAGSVRTLAAPAASALADALAPSPAAITVLRAWLAERLNWRPT